MSIYVVYIPIKDDACGGQTSQRYNLFIWSHTTVRFETKLCERYVAT